MGVYAHTPIFGPITNEVRDLVHNMIRSPRLNCYRGLVNESFMHEILVVILKKLPSLQK